MIPSKKRGYNPKIFNIFSNMLNKLKLLLIGSASSYWYCKCCPVVKYPPYRSLFNKNNGKIDIKNMNANMKILDILNLFFLRKLRNRMATITGTIKNSSALIKIAMLKKIADRA